MTSNNWIEEFDKEFPFGSFAGSSVRTNEVQQFISNLFTKKDQEHKAKLEMIKGELQSEKVGYEHDRNANTGSYGKTVAGVQRDTMEQAISILDKHINKLSTE